MQKLIQSLITVIGVSLVGIGIASASAASLDCGDDDAQPISTQTVTEVVIKDS